MLNCILIERILCCILCTLACLPFTGYVVTGLCVSQVKVREEDEGWIYGMYTCRSGNKMGSADWEIELKRASKWHGHHDNLHANNDIFCFFTIILNMSITLHAMFFVIIVAFCFILCASVCVSLESEHSLNGWSLWFLGFFY